jgi:hypothetical protein
MMWMGMDCTTRASLDVSMMDMDYNLEITTILCEKRLTLCWIMRSLSKTLHLQYLAQSGYVEGNPLDCSTALQTSNSCHERLYT